MSDVRHFPTGLPNYHEVGPSQGVGRCNKAFVEPIVSLLTDTQDANSDAPDGLDNDIFNRLKHIESILRNGLPRDNRSEANVIAHAHSEIEVLLESIDSAWWLK